MGLPEDVCRAQPDHRGCGDDTARKTIGRGTGAVRGLVTKTVMGVQSQSTPSAASRMGQNAKAATVSGTSLVWTGLADYAAAQAQ